MPRALLAQAGLDSERDFAERRYTGGHADSLQALVAGALDVVGVLPEPPGDDLAEALRNAPEADSIARALAAAWPE